MYLWCVCLTVPGGIYTGANLASGIQDLLNGCAVTFGFEVLCHPARGTITMYTKYEGMGSHNNCDIPNDFGIMTWMTSILISITHGKIVKGMFKQQELII